MWIKVFKIICIYFAMKKVNADLHAADYKMNYYDTYKLIFKYFKYDDQNKYDDVRNKRCLILIDDTFEFYCFDANDIEHLSTLIFTNKTDDLGLITKFDGYCKLDKASVDMYRICQLEQQRNNHNTPNCNDKNYQMNILTKCKVTLIETSLPDVEYEQRRVKSERHGKCMWNGVKCSEILHVFEHVEKLFVTGFLIDGNNGVQIPGIVYKLGYTGTNLSILDIIEINCGNYEAHDIINASFFENATNLSQLVLQNCIITALFSETINVFKNLKSLHIKYTKLYDFDWLSSENLKNNLEYLELYKSVGMRDIYNAMLKLEEYSNLSIFDYYPNSHFVVSLEKVRICAKSMNYCTFRMTKNLTELKGFDKANACNNNKDICDYNFDILHKNQCPNGCSCFFDDLELIYAIDCSLSFRLTQVPELPTVIIVQQLLLINNQNLTKLPNSTLNGYFDLWELHVSNNHLTSLTVDNIPPKLTYLDITNNNIKTLDKDVLDFLSNRSKTIRLKVSGNPWHCDCSPSSILAVDRKGSYEIADYLDIKCVDENGELISYDARILMCGESHKYYYIIVAIIGCTLAFAVTIITCYKKSIKMWLYERNYCVSCISRPEPDIRKDLKIDAFLAFSHLDSEFVQEFVEKLEKGPHKFELCFYQRDWLIGESIPECIMKSIEESNRIIILMTKNFVNSSWGRFEFRTAIHAASMDPNKRIIIIVYPEVENFNTFDTELRLYMKFNTYLRRDDPHFWRKLIYAMPHRTRQSRQAAITDGREVEESHV